MNTISYRFFFFVGIKRQSKKTNSQLDINIRDENTKRTAGKCMFTSFSRWKKTPFFTTHPFFHDSLWESKWKDEKCHSENNHKNSKSNYAKIHSLVDTICIDPIDLSDSINFLDRFWRDWYLTFFLFLICLCAKRKTFVEGA